MENQHTEHQASPVSLDTAVELSFDYLKQLGTIAMTAAGGLIALAQFVEGDKGFFIKIMMAASLLFLSAILAFFAQFSLVYRVRRFHDLLHEPAKKTYSHDAMKKHERFFESMALWLLSISIGIALYALFAVGVPA